MYKMICTIDVKKETRPWHCCVVCLMTGSGSSVTSTVKASISINITSSSLHSLGFGGTFGFAAGEGNGRDGMDGFFGLDVAGLGVIGRGLLMGGSCW